MARYLRLLRTSGFAGDSRGSDRCATARVRPLYQNPAPPRQRMQRNRPVEWYTAILSFNAPVPAIGPCAFTYETVQLMEDANDREIWR